MGFLWIEKDVKLHPNVFFKTLALIPNKTDENVAKIKKETQ